ncbi:hypothetical protein [Thalassoglobus polymorphus]|uniref:Uncharacterized protein n=1 Tax=Thalassoglobus polymorphus TaxID=2527994 RepID=A0A517QT31_9PLAN|nr:hypothetical protein [Thalassoglobus polymorphus]QDT34800.1 hypothetical protein Mal48_40720 [Thalassoglobus polymorphus]
MLADDVQAHFPPGINLPEPIRALCEFLEANGYPLSGCFEISTIGDGDLQAWFPSDTTMQNRFAVFGRGSTGSVYAIWLQDHGNADASPVVVLGSEGELLILATDSKEFCRLLGCGYDELEWDDISQPSPGWDDTKPLREWLASRFDIDFPTTGKQIVDVARDRYPDFSQFVQSWWDANA